MRPDISAEDAIRRVVVEGGCADYVDVANAVHDRFGHRVGAGRVEEVVRAMKDHPPKPPASRLKDAEIRLTSQRSEPPATAPAEPAASATPAASIDDAATRREHTLKFVEAMGGFHAAREALTDLEDTLRRLMPSESSTTP